MMGGLMRGLLLGGLIGMLLGGGFHGIFGLFGFLIQLFLLVMVGRFLWGMFAGGRSGMGNMPGGPGTFAQQAGAPVGMANAPVAIVPADYQAFEQLLQAIQQAWTQHDVNALRMTATPEMVSYFGEQLAEQTSRGVRNFVTNVHLEQGDLSEAWAEEGREYATVAMRFTMVDVTTDQAGHVVAGDPNLRTQATELWTFLRAPGGRWVLSAIQQVR
jgi:predicted lipid-binding transport protein (Tim44 family)